MFSGIVEEAGTVISAAPAAGSGWRLEVAAGLAGEGAAVGDSIAVNGCCLTLVASGQGRLAFDLLEETRRLTNLAALAPGSRINLERSLRFDGRVGGHFVTGHVDGPGTVDTCEPRGGDHLLRVSARPGAGLLVVPKGSVTIDGVALTVAEADGDRFAVWLIPHTLQVTNLGRLRPGDIVNLEFDLLGKYVQKLLNERISCAHLPEHPR